MAIARQEKLNIAQVGCGYWGPNLIRNFSSISKCNLVAVAESSKERKRYIESSFPHINNEYSFKEILENNSINAVILATPAKSHFEQAKKSLIANKHVFVEKPMATKVCEVEELRLIAENKNLTLMSGHTFIYNSAVKFIKTFIDSGEIGEIRYLYSQRLNLGRIRSDVNALWNFAPHDISIIQYLLNDEKPIDIKYTGMDFMQKGIDDVAFLNLRYNSFMANIHVSWLDPNKTRKVVIVGSRKMIVYDDVAEDKITIYDKGIDKYSKLGENMDFDNLQHFSFRYRSGDIWIPKIDYIEPLKTEAEHFINCILSGEEPLSGAKHTRNVINILETASKI